MESAGTSVITMVLCRTTKALVASSKEARSAVRSSYTSRTSRNQARSPTSRKAMTASRPENTEMPKRAKNGASTTGSSGG